MENKILNEVLAEVRQLRDRIHETDEWWTREQAAEYLGYSYATIHNMCNDGRLHPVKRLLRASEVKQYPKKKTA